MPILKQSFKALRQSKKKELRNMKVREDLKTLIKKIRSAIDNKVEQAKIEEMLKKVQISLDKAAQKKVIKKNRAGRKLGRLVKYSQRVNKKEVKTEDSTTKTE